MQPPSRWWKWVRFPDNFKNLLKLKGVGEYTAAAIASFAYNEKVAVVDGNVYRVLSRFYNIATPINSTDGIKEFKELANNLIPASDPATFNQAIMEFGALQCVPSNPDCQVCPLVNHCAAYRGGTISIRPIKIKKTKVKKLFHHYLVIQTPAGKTVINQRDQSGIWAGLHEFPYIESTGALLPGELEQTAEFKNIVGDNAFTVSPYNQEPIIHLLSHRRIHAYFWIVELDNEIPRAIPVKEAFAKSLHVLMERFMKEFWKLE